MISKKEYSTIVKNNSPKSKCFVNGTKAFFIGGFICLIGQVLTDCYSMLDLSKDDAKTLTSVTLIFIGILLTAIGVYDKNRQAWRCRYACADYRFCKCCFIACN